MDPSGMGHPGTWLLVEDELPLLQLLRRVMERAGHPVICVTTLAAATAVLSEGTVALTGMIVDEVLPDGPGSVLVEQAQMLRPGLLALRISGHPDLGRAPGVLSKPFSVPRFASEVQQLLLRRGWPDPSANLA